MHTVFSRREWHRIEHWLIWIAALGILLFLLVPLAADKADVQTRPAGHPITKAQKVGLPFTAANVADYFSTALEISVDRKASGRLVFENQQFLVPEDFWHIEIWAESGSVMIEFTVGGDYGMTLAREFFECPLFERQETEKFYEMLGDAQNSPVARLPRFSISMAYKAQTHLEILHLRFAPAETIGKR